MTDRNQGAAPWMPMGTNVPYLFFVRNMFFLKVELSGRFNARSHDLNFGGEPDGGTIPATNCCTRNRKHLEIVGWQWRYK
jgi:hypothetical protein